MCIQIIKAVKNTVEQNKVGGEVITGEDILCRQGRLYYDWGETLLHSRGDFLMGESISRDTGNIKYKFAIVVISYLKFKTDVKLILILGHRISRYYS